MNAERYLYTGSDKDPDLRTLPTDSKKDEVSKKVVIAAFEENVVRIQELQDRFHADAREGIVFVIQALDAAGKDSLIKHVFSRMNHQGVRIENFKAPSAEELAHDYLWRIHKVMPRRGDIVVLNRSHYEDVVTVDVNNIWQKYHMPERTLNDSREDFFRKRYRQIRDYEEYLYENGYRVVKIFLNVSKDTQKERFLERIERPEKNWKFNAGDLDDRAKFDAFLDRFSTVIRQTATDHSPWYALPADQKWYTRYLLSEIMIDTFEKCKSRYPEMTDEQKAEMERCKESLLNE